MSFLGKLFGNNDDIVKPVEQANPTTSTPAEPAGPGVMIVSDVFSIKGRGTVATGRVESGEFYLGESVVIETVNGPIQTVINGVETFHRTVDRAVAGDNVGLLLKDVERQDIEQGAKIQAI